MFTVGQSVTINETAETTPVLPTVVGLSFTIDSIEGAFENIAKGVLADGRTVQISFENLRET